MSRRTRVALALYIGFVIYSLGVFLWGRTGVAAGFELSALRTRLEANMVVLQQVNGQLAAEFDALRSDPTTIRLEARQLGYLEPGERPIDIVGRPNGDTSFAVGTLVAEKAQRFPNDSLFRGIGAGSALIFLLTSGIVARRKNAHIHPRPSSETEPH